MQKYAILINTCDNFEDCWDPFFKLWSIYWKDCKAKIYLNTEYKDYSYPGLDITAIKGCEANNFPKNKRAKWSQCLKWALDAIDDDIILYMQEDYFLNGMVKNEWINNFFKVMYKHKEESCIHLTPKSIPALGKSVHNNLCTSDPDYFSYVSCQCSFWRKDVMHSLIREHESAWNFEWWGSKRAKYQGLKFLVVNPVWLNRSKFQIVPYVFTGVIGGKWNKQVVELFKNNGITIDYSKRGFYKRNEKLTLKKRIKTKLNIWERRSIIEYWNLKYKTSLK